MHLEETTSGIKKKDLPELMTRSVGVERGEGVCFFHKRNKQTQWIIFPEKLFHSASFTAYYSLQQQAHFTPLQISLATSSKV